MHKHLNIIILLSAFLFGCANNRDSMQGNRQMGNLLLAEPAPMNQRSQLAIARYSHILGNTDLEDEQRAQMLHQRGTLYDSVGLSGQLLIFLPGWK